MNKINAKKLEKLGLTTAGKELKEREQFERKCMLAYEFYRAVTPEHIDRHNDKLKKNTLKMTGKEGADLYHNYDKLQFIALKDYDKIPPTTALKELEIAQGRKCFDNFEVCKIESVREYKDPIIFGRIDKCPDKFFVCQWDNDIKIEDILEENEG